MEKYRRNITEDLPTILVDTTRASEVAAGAADNYELTVPNGYVLHIQSIHIYITPPPGATTGTHRVSVYDNNTKASLGVWLQGLYTGIIQPTYQDGAFSGTTFYPADRAAFIQALTTITPSNGGKLVVAYVNNTNVATTEPRVIQIAYKLVPMS